MLLAALSASALGETEGGMMGVVPARNEYRPDPAPTPLSTPKKYHIGPEDVLEIKVWGQEDLSKAVEVSPVGIITYPLVGDVAVDGLTPQEVEKELAALLGQGYLKAPKVSVSVKEFKSKKIMVFGLVHRPGLYRVRGKMKLLEVLFMVGSTMRESGNRLVVLRRKEGEPLSQPKQVQEFLLDDLLLEGDLSKNIEIHPGDYVYVSSSVQDKRRYYVMGEVRSPGPIDFSRNLTLMEAIKSAGGFTDYASKGRVKVIREEGARKITFKVNVKEIEKGKKSDDFYVEAGDVVVVPESWF